MKTKRKSPKTLKKYWKEIFYGSIPQPSLKQQQDMQWEWETRVAIAHLMGITEKHVFDLAQEEYRRTVKDYTGRGYTGDETWEKDCDPSCRFNIFNRILPHFDIFERQSVITGPSKLMLVATYNVK